MLFDNAAAIVRSEESSIPRGGMNELYRAEAYFVNASTSLFGIVFSVITLSRMCGHDLNGTCPSIRYIDIIICDRTEFR